MFLDKLIGGVVDRLGIGLAEDVLQGSGLGGVLIDQVIDVGEVDVKRDVHIGDRSGHGAEFFEYHMR